MLLAIQALFNGLMNSEMCQNATQIHVSIAARGTIVGISGLLIFFRSITAIVAQHFEEIALTKSFIQMQKKKILSSALTLSTKIDR